MLSRVPPPSADIPDHPEVVYKFGVYLLNPADRQLLRDERAVSLAPKMFDALLMLVENHDHLVERDQFLRRLWPRGFINEEALAHCISQLRRALGDSPHKCRFIKTVPKRGYRFVAATEVVPAAAREVPGSVRVGVLPFENLGADPEREYLADGFTEETIAALGQIDPDHLSVIGRTTMMAYKRTIKSLAEIGSELVAAYLIESSIRSEAGRLRITSKLIRVHGQTQIWTATFDNEVTSILAYQRELSTAIAEQVRLRIAPERLSALARRQTRNTEAYDLYLRGRYFWNQLSPPTTRRAMEFYARATALDPKYAIAWSGLADAFTGSTINGDARPLDVWPRARAAIGNAVESEPDLAEAQTSLGIAAFFLDWNWQLAERALRKAVELDPFYCLAHRTLGIVLSYLRRHAESQLAVRRARELEPLNVAHHALSAQVAFNASAYPEAIAFARHATVLDSEFWIGYLQLAQAYEQTGDHDLALDALQHAGRFSGGNSKVMALRGYLLAKLGRADEAREVLNTLQAVSLERYVPPYAMALVNAGLGERHTALECLDRAYEARDVNLIFLPADPKWDTFRSDAQFVGLLRRCGFDQLPPPP